LNLKKEYLAKNTKKFKNEGEKHLPCKKHVKWLVEVTA
jgi:hypothetical protein